MVKGGFITIFLFTYLGVKQYTFSLQIHFSESFVQHYKKDIHFKLVFFFFLRPVFFEVFVAFKNQGKYSKSIIFHCKT